MTATHGYCNKSSKIPDGQQGGYNTGGSMSSSGGGNNKGSQMLGQIRYSMSELINIYKDTTQNLNFVCFQLDFQSCMDH